MQLQIQEIRRTQLEFSQTSLSFPTKSAGFLINSLPLTGVSETQSISEVKFHRSSWKNASAKNDFIGMIWLLVLHSVWQWGRQA